MNIYVYMYVYDFMMILLYIYFMFSNIYIYLYIYSANYPGGSVSYAEYYGIVTRPTAGFSQ